MTGVSSVGLTARIFVSLVKGDMQKLNMGGCKIKQQAHHYLCPGKLGIKWACLLPKNNLCCEMFKFENLFLLLESIQGTILVQPFYI